MSTITGETDDGDYATLRGPTGDLLHLSDLSMMNIGGGGIGGNGGGGSCDLADDTSEEGKLLACVRDDSVTYASTRDLEPPIPPLTTITTINQQQPLQLIVMNNNIDIDDTLPEPYLGSPDKLISPMAPVTVTVHSTEIHVSSIITTSTYNPINHSFSLSHTHRSQQHQHHVVYVVLILVYQMKR